MSGGKNQQEIYHNDLLYVAKDQSHSIRREVVHREPTVAKAASRHNAMDVAGPPLLSTPAEHILDATDVEPPRHTPSKLNEEEFIEQYEIHKTVQEIHKAGYQSVALQFPDEMLVDAPRIVRCLQDRLNDIRWSETAKSDLAYASDETREGMNATMQQSASLAGAAAPRAPHTAVKLCILADTSYGACCVDEVAAEHVNADVVVHYGRSCLSSTARLPVIYVFTSKPLNLAAVLAAFRETYSDRSEKVCLMADIPYAHHIDRLSQSLHHDGYTNVFATQIVRDPSSPLPNRTVPSEVVARPEGLKDYSIFHISSPPTSLLLILSSRVKSMHIFSTNGQEDGYAAPAVEASAAQILRRRYALITRLSTASIFGILVNTLSVSNYMTALKHCQEVIARAGKKSYVFVVGKINTAKLANFSEVGGWVIIGCWESSLTESRDFYRPVITPFELDLALASEETRVWNGDWIGDFATLLDRRRINEVSTKVGGNDISEVDGDRDHMQLEDEQNSDDEPPEFDLRTGRYVSHTRPMRRQPGTDLYHIPANMTTNDHETSSALMKRAQGQVSTIAGTFSPAAHHYRENRTWHGLGDDPDIAYERDENGDIVGSAVEEGRSGLAQGYTVGIEEQRS